MDIEKFLKEYFDKKEKFLKVSRDLEEVKKILKPNMSIILKLYYLKERQIYKKYKIFRTSYQYIIGFDDYDDFDIENIEEETEDYILLDCWFNYNGEDFTAKIKFPKNFNEIDLYVEQFGDEIESNLIMKKLINK